MCHASTKTLRRSAEEGGGAFTDSEHSRREIMLQSVNLAIFGDAVAGTGTDPTTIINSILGELQLDLLWLKPRHLSDMVRLLVDYHYSVWFHSYGG